jgi:hypothetical protein
MRWKDDPARRALFSLYADADALVADATCACTPGSETATAEPPGPGDRAERVPCCHFGVTGREPYPTAVELAEVEYALGMRGQRKKQTRRLPLVDETRSCPLLSEDGRCTIYASRPLGCRTFFCDRGDGPPRRARQPLLEIARRVADLSARAFPRDPRPRPLTGALKRMA